MLHDKFEEWLENLGKGKRSSPPGTPTEDERALVFRIHQRSRTLSGPSTGFDRGFSHDKRRNSIGSTAEYAALRGKQDGEEHALYLEPDSESHSSNSSPSSPSLRSNRSNETELIVVNLTEQNGMGEAEFNKKTRLVMELSTEHQECIDAGPSEHYYSGLFDPDIIEITPPASTNSHSEEEASSSSSRTPSPVSEVRAEEPAGFDPLLDEFRMTEAEEYIDAGPSKARGEKTAPVSGSLVSWSNSDADSITLIPASESGVDEVVGEEVLADEPRDIEVQNPETWKEGESVKEQAWVRPEYLQQELDAIGDKECLFSMFESNSDSNDESQEQDPNESESGQNPRHEQVSSGLRDKDLGDEEICNSNEEAEEDEITLIQEDYDKIHAEELERHMTWLRMHDNVKEDEADRIKGAKTALSETPYQEQDDQERSEYADPFEVPSDAASPEMTIEHLIDTGPAVEEYSNYFNKQNSIITPVTLLRHGYDYSEWLHDKERRRTKALHLGKKPCKRHPGKGASELTRMRSLLSQSVDNLEGLAEDIASKRGPFRPYDSAKLSDDIVSEGGMLRPDNEYTPRIFEDDDGRRQFEGKLRDFVEGQSHGQEVPKPIKEADPRGDSPMPQKSQGVTDGVECYFPTQLSPQQTDSKVSVCANALEPQEREQEDRRLASKQSFTKQEAAFHLKLVRGRLAINDTGGKVKGLAETPELAEAKQLALLDKIDELRAERDKLQERKNELKRELDLHEHASNPFRILSHRTELLEFVSYYFQELAQRFSPHTTYCPSRSEIRDAISADITFDDLCDRLEGMDMVFARDEFRHALVKKGFTTLEALESKKQLRQMIRKLRREVLEVYETLETGAKHIDNLEGQKSNLSQEIEQLKSQLEETSSALAVLVQGQQEAETAKALRDTTTESLDDSTATSNVIDELTESQTAQLESYIARVDQATTKAAAGLRGKEQELASKCEKIKGLEVGLENTVEFYAEESDMLFREVRQLQELQAAHEQENYKKDQKVDDATALVYDELAVARRYKDLFEQKCDELLQSESENESLRHVPTTVEKQNMHDQLMRSVLRIEDLEAENLKLRREKEAEDLRAKLKEKDGEIYNLNCQVYDLEENNDKLTGERDDLQRDFHDWRAARNIEIEHYFETQEDLHAKIVELHQSRKPMTSEELREANERLCKDYEKGQEEVELLRGANYKLTLELRRMTLLHQQRPIKNTAKLERVLAEQKKKQQASTKKMLNGFAKEEQDRLDRWSRNGWKIPVSLEDEKQKRRKAREFVDETIWYATVPSLMPVPTATF